jgi:ribosomal protein S27AE
VRAGRAADKGDVASLTVECLRCGRSRPFTPGPRRNEESGSCPRCGYVGWAYSADLSERTRRLVRDLPLERRLHIRPV